MARDLARHGLAAASVAFWVSACTLVASFPELGTESGPDSCSDGRDNDLDGRLDCEDSECASLCNRCGEVAFPDVDALGQVCARDCECPDGATCNDRVRIALGGDGQVFFSSRCAPEPDPVEDGFDISFLVQEGAPPDGSSNVQGRARFNGEEVSIETATWFPEDGLFDFRGPVERGLQRTILVFVPTLSTPTPQGSVQVRISDAIVESNPGPVRGDFGRLPVGGDPSGLSLNQDAVVSSSTLSFESLEASPDGFWQGRFRGMLRSASGFDRARACIEISSVYDGESGRCRPIDRLEALFYLACVYRADGSVARGLGEISSTWTPFWTFGQAYDHSTGECAGRLEGDVVRIRAAVDRRDVFEPVDSYVLDLTIPRFRSVSDVGLDIGSEVQATIYRTARAEMDTSTALLDLNLDEVPDSERRDLVGTLRIDEQRSGEDGRFLGWIKGELVRP